MVIEPIGHMRTPYPTKFGVPRQPELVSALTSRLVLEGGFARPDIVRGLDGFEYVWVIWAFSHNLRENGGGWPATVRPPRLGGTKRVGVLASRSSFRPNGLAISCLRLLAVDLAQGVEIELGGADMVDGTPVFDVKPYLPYADAHAGARAGWTQQAAWPRLEVDLPADLCERVPPQLREGLVQVLEQDPRPAYTRARDDRRVFWIPLGTIACFFRVREGVARVVDVCQLDEATMDELRATGTVARFERRCAADKGSGN